MHLFYSGASKQGELYKAAMDSFIMVSMFSKDRRMYELY